MNNVCKTPWSEVQRMIRRQDDRIKKKKVADQKKLALAMKPTIDKLTSI